MPLSNAEIEAVITVLWHTHAGNAVWVLAAAPSNVGYWG
jgi:hypothetical protein